MKYKEFKDGVQLSRLGMGAMRLPETKDGQIDYEKAKEIIEQAYQGGINYFDTAYIYHNGFSETVLAKILKQYPRHTYYIADKYNYQSSTDFAGQFAEQLEKMELEHIDFYLLHGIQDNFTDDILACGCIDYFENMKKTGKIRYFGFSFHGSEASLDKMLAAYSKWDFVQIQLNYYDWEYGNQKAVYKKLEEAGIPVMVMEPVHGGLLARTDTRWAEKMLQVRPGRSVASWAMRWLFDLDALQVILSGMGDLDMLQDNLKTFEEGKPLDAGEHSMVKEATRMLRAETALPCTGCRYCCAACPMGLNIPGLLADYNEVKLEAGGSWRLQRQFGLPDDKRATACIGCGACTAHCPQQLPIPSAMKEMTDIMKSMGQEKVTEE